MGEFLDTLKSFGMTEADPLIQAGVEFILSRQNPDGSWGDAKHGDTYHFYHSTWTSMNGLMDYRYRGERVSFPDALQGRRRTAGRVSAQPGWSAKRHRGSLSRRDSRIARLRLRSVRAMR